MDVLLEIFHNSIFTVKGFKLATCRIQNTIRKCRFNHDEMTQKELADKVGVTRQTILTIEKGNYSPSLELAFRIALVFDKPLEDIFSFSPEEKSTK